MSSAMNRYDPKKWYWIVAGSTTEVFSSERQVYVAVSDSSYQSWIAQGYFPTRIASEQELLNVLAVQEPGIVLHSTDGLAVYAKTKQAKVAVSGISVSVGTQQSPQTIDAETDPADLILLQGAYTLAQADSDRTFDWVQSNGTSVTLSASQIGTIFTAVSSFIQATFTTLSGVLAAIGSGTITTKNQVDAPPSPIPAWPATLAS